MDRQFKVIYFDMDGTLVDYESDSWHAFQKAVEHAADSYPRIAGIFTHDMFKRAREVTYIQYGDTGIPLRDWYRECMRAILGSVEIFDVALADRMGQLYGLFRNTSLNVFEDALDVIPKLAGTYKLGLISNGSSKIQKLPIAEFFSFSVYAREVGHEKPSPEIFQEAVRIGGCSNGETLFVGDGQHTDILGAKNAGAKMAWINRTGERLLTGIPRPDYEICDLRELLEIAPVL